MWPSDQRLVGDMMTYGADVTIGQNRLKTTVMQDQGSPSTMNQSKMANENEGTGQHNF